MLFASPQSPASPAFARLTGAQLPTGPTQTSGACENDSRTTAVVFPSRDGDRLGPGRPPAPALSAPRQSVSILPLPVSRAANPLPPSTYSPKRISPGERQASQSGVAARPGVRFRGSPPAIGITK